MPAASLAGICPLLVGKAEGEGLPGCAVALSKELGS